MPLNKILDKITRLNPLWAVMPLSLLGMFYRFQLRAQTGLWVDEHYQVVVLQQSFMKFFRELPRWDFCGYLNGDYFLTWPFVQIFGENKWGLAIPHIIITAVGYWVLYILCRRYLKTFWGYFITFSVFNLNINLIMHAFEIRPYSVLAVLGMAMFYASETLFDKGFKMTGREMLGYGFLYVLTILYHPYGVLIVFFITVYFLTINCEYKMLARTIRQMVPFFLIVMTIAMPIWYDSVFGSHATIGKHQIKDVFLFIPSLITNPVGFFKGIFCNLIGNKWNYIFFPGFILALLLPHTDRYKQLAFFLLLFAIPLEMILYADIKNNYWFIQRQFIWMMPLFALLLGWAWESVGFYILGKINKA